MKIFVIGGTGFIGYHAVKEFLHRGHKVTVLALPPLPVEELLPPEVEIIFANLNDLPDNEVRALLQNQDAVVYAAGADDRTVPKAPAYPFFYRENVESCVRLFTLARQAGIKRGVLIGSYFAHFDRIWPNMKLSACHPYIRSRQEQASRSLEVSIPDLELMVLELPYVFGILPGRVPLWSPLIRYVSSPLPILFYPRGGTNMVAVKHVAEAIVGAIEQGKAGEIYQIGEKNLTWEAFLRRLSELTGQKKGVITLPDWVVRLGTGVVTLFYKIQGKEGGLNPVLFTALQTAETFFDPETSREALGYGQGGFEDALRKTVEVCLA
jgi:dihydroflavonol-4-reductase